jgi:uncharacterized protein (DUF849 family)
MTAAAAGAALVTSAASAGPDFSHHKKRVTERRKVADTPVIFEVAINGSTTRKANKHAPETPRELGEEAIRCFDAGATIVHAHSGQPKRDAKAAARVYAEVFGPVREKHPYGIMYPTANFDAKAYHKQRGVWPPESQSGHYRPLAEAGLANMILLDTGVVPLAGYDERGVPKKDQFWWYGFWPGDTDIVLDVCNEYGTGTSISVFEPGWMKNVVAMAEAGSLPRGSKLNIYFADYGFGAMAPPTPEALFMYLEMIEGLDLKWSVGMPGTRSIMDTPLARLALERGGSFRVGLEDWVTGPSNLEQMERAKDLIDQVGRPVVTGADAIKYLDIPFAATRP